MGAAALSVIAGGSVHTHTEGTEMHRLTGSWHIWCRGGTGHSTHPVELLTFHRCIYCSVLCSGAPRAEHTHFPSPLQLPPELSLLNVWPASCSHKTHYLLWTIISAKSRKYYRTRKRKMRAGRLTKIGWVC